MAIPPTFGRVARVLRSYLPELNFITIHYAYFIFTSLITALVFWGSSTPFKSVSFIDSLFLTTSAMTEAGLNTVNLSEFNTFQQFILFFLIMIGSAIFVSAFIVLVRLRAFNKEFDTVIRRRKKQKLLSRSGSVAPRLALDTDVERDNRAADLPQASDTSHSSEQKDPALMPDMVNQTDIIGLSQYPFAQDRGRNSESKVATSAQTDGGLSPTSPQHIIFRPDTRFGHLHSPDRDHEIRHRRLFSFTGVGASPSPGLRPRSTSALSRTPTNATSTHERQLSTDPWFRSAAGYFVRNSGVEGLTFEERQELGGCEYSAVLFLSFLVPFYFFIWQFLGCLALGAWINNNRADTALANGINPWWLGAFNAVSAFNNSGMSLLDANMTAFQDAVFLLLSMGLFILAGNTAYPIFLRAAVWAVWKALPDTQYWKYDRDTLRFLLDHPRRCYTNMFPARHTWWLGLALIALNGVDWAAFEILNIGNKQITVLSPGYEILDGLFQALAVRSGGFYVVTIPDLRISLQVLYVLMMYISAFPVAITMRNSNVYEERSLGLFAEDQEESPDAGSQAAPTMSGANGAMGTLKRRLTTLTTGNRSEARSYFVRHQVRAQLSHDIWWLALAVFVIMIIEGGEFERDPVTFSVFNVIFEVVSGYGCVGISVGVPYAAYSFSGAWRTLSKLVLIAVMIRGRHRGLPVAIDHAVQLPSTGFDDAAPFSPAQF